MKRISVLSRIYLTEEGKAVTRRTRECIKEREKALFKDFSEARFVSCAVFFLQMIQNLEEGGNEKNIERQNKG